MPNRYTGGSDYRYAYQGSEKDDEITGVEGAHVTTFFREIDTRLGRMWSVDPVFQPWQSPYGSMDNTPIWRNDIRGDDPNDYTVDETGKVIDVVENDQPHRIFEQNKDGNKKQLFFNDPTNDRGGLGHQKVGDKLVYNINNEGMNWIMNEADVNPEQLLFIPNHIDFAVSSSFGGHYDFAVSQLWGSLGVAGGPILGVGEAEATPVFVKFTSNDVIFNIMDAGNYLWGYSAARSGFTYSDITGGSNLHALIFNEGFSFDSRTDQQAIRQGYFSGANYSNELFKNIFNLSSPTFTTKSSKPDWIIEENSYNATREKERKR